MIVDNFPYEKVDEFIQSCLIKHESLFSGQPIRTNPSKLLSAYYSAYSELSKKDGKEDSKAVKFELMLDKLNKILEENDNIELLNHAIWLWAFPNNKRSLPIYVDKGNSKKAYEEYCSLFTSDGVAGAGSGYVQYKSRGVLFCLYLICKLWENTNCSCYNCCYLVKQSIKNLLLDNSRNYKNEYNVNSDINYKIPESVRNLLLHLLSPDEYEPIASQRDKQLIRDTFGFLIQSNGNTDKDIKSIRTELSKDSHLHNSFYEEGLALMWRSFSNSDLSLAQMLKIKKSVILYGPPGTGKTYTARQIAKQLAIQPQIDILKDKNSAQDAKTAAWDAIKQLCSPQTNTNGIEPIDDYISNLQFHINYSYEDFMVGQTIKGNDIVIKPGFIFDVIKKANADSNKPHIIILDEINRTDISRVFGELFSAMEYRRRKYTLPYRIDPSKLQNDYKEYKEFFDEKNGEMFMILPSNLYFIGTMNEIDFSLERVDFALRRRFLWEYVGYQEDALEEMLKSKEWLKSVDYQSFINSCGNLNKVIAAHPDLGQKYEIGHAFFDISKELWEQAKKIDVVKKILWQISILPTLEAYCGSMDENNKTKLIKDCNESFLKSQNNGR